MSAGRAVVAGLAIAAATTAGSGPAGGARWVDTAFAAIRGEQRPVDFDHPRVPPWRGAGESQT